jgi:cytochrome b6-f complex iron-sulfur subunit
MKEHELVEIDDVPETGLSRRSFLKLGMGALGALAAVEIGGAGFMFLRARSQEGELGEVITAGKVDSFPAGSVTEFPGAHFFLVRASDGGFLALHSRCPHLGCIVTWEPEKDQFLCPCHASSFDRYGDFDSPPVPRALDTFAVTVKDGQVLVDTAQLTQRDEFSPDQLAYAQ